MSKIGSIERDVWRQIIRSFPRQPLTALNNARFMVAMRIGGFTSAGRDPK